MRGIENMKSLLEDKEKLLSELSKRESIKSTENHVYSISHFYEDTPPIIFNTNIRVEVLSPLLAFIEFQIEDNISGELHTGVQEMLKIIDKVYSPIEIVSNDSVKTEFDFDMYENREYWCGMGLEEHKLFSKKNLISEAEIVLKSEIEWLNSID
jgi:hypothetical protein